MRATMAWAGRKGRRARRERGFSAADFVIASGLVVVVGTVAAFMYAKGQKVMTSSVQFMNAADQVGESSRALDRAFALAGVGAPMEYPAGLALPGVIIQATNTAVTFLSELDKDPTFLTQDADVSATTIQVTSANGFQAGDRILIFERYFTAEATISGIAGTTFTLSAPLAIRLRERAQVSRPRRVQFSLEDDPTTGRKRIVRTVTKYEDGTARVRPDQDYGRGIESASFSYYDHQGVLIPIGELTTAARRRDIKEILFDVRWPVSPQMQSRSGGVVDRFQIQSRIRPWNLKRDRTN